MRVIAKFGGNYIMKIIQDMQPKTKSWANCCNKTIDDCTCKSINQRIWVTS